MKMISISVRDKLPAVTAMTGTAVADNKYLLKFDFDSEWLEGLKTVVVAGARKQYIPYPTETDEVTVELGDARVIYVGVIQDTIATSRPCQIIVNDSIRKHMGEEIVPPEEDIWTFVTESIRTLNASRLYPVEKTDAMNQQVGADGEGRLWTYPGGTGGRGVDRVMIMSSVSTSGTPTYSLWIFLQDGNVVTCTLPNMGIELSDVVTVSPSSPVETGAGGYVGELWFDTRDRILFVCVSSVPTLGVPNWLPVTGGGDTSETSTRGVTDVVFNTGLKSDGSKYYELRMILEDVSEITRELPMFANSDVAEIRNGPPGEAAAPLGKFWVDTSEPALYLCVSSVWTGEKQVSEWMRVAGGKALPEYTDADEGKFLRIVDGAAAWASIINGEEVKF